MGVAASYKPWPVFTYSNGYWEVYRRFQGDFFGWGGGYVGGELSMEEFFMGKENFHEGAQDSLAFFKEQPKNKCEKVFSTEIKEQH